MQEPEKKLTIHVACLVIFSHTQDTNPNHDCTRYHATLYFYNYFSFHHARNYIRTGKEHYMVIILEELNTPEPVLGF
jgi:hypothetical protein